MTFPEWGDEAHTVKSNREDARRWETSNRTAVHAVKDVKELINQRRKRRKTFILKALELKYSINGSKETIGEKIFRGAAEKMTSYEVCRAYILFICNFNDVRAVQIFAMLQIDFSDGEKLFPSRSKMNILSRLWVLNFAECSARVLQL